jgi:hypothetical protein
MGKINANLYMIAQVILLLVGYIGFEVYAYMYLFGHFRELIGTIISLLATVSFTTMTVLRIIDWQLDPAPAATNL